MTALLPALAGALIVAGIIGVAVGLRKVPPRAPAPTKPRPGAGRVASLSRRTRILLLAGTAAGLLVAVLTGWVVAVLVVPAAAAGLPVLLSAPPAAAKIDRLEAMEEWTRSLSGVLTAGVGLEQALIATLRSTPDPIRPEVTKLASRLRARWSTEDALRAFADDLDDATGDVIAANLILGARRRGTGLASVLDALAESVAADVRARREIEADRAKPRATARWVTIITVTVLAFLSLTGNYVAPFGTPLGQVLLAALLSPVRGDAGVDAADGHRHPPAQIRRPGCATGGELMATGLQVAIAAGALLGLSAALLVWRLVPAQPDLRDALERLSPDHARRRTHTVAAATDPTQRLGLWGMKVLPAPVWGRTPTRELAILRQPVSQFYGEKIRYALLGLAIPPLLTALFTLLGADLPFVIPVVATVGFAAVMFFLPDYNVRDDAKRARAEFSRALGAYIDLVALERLNGSGPRQAMEAAAAVGRLVGVPPPDRGAGPHPLVRPHPLGGAASPRRRAGPERAGGPGRHHAPVRGGRRPGVRLAAGPLRRDAHRDAQHREGQGQRGRRTDVDPDEPARRDLPGHPAHPRPAARHGRHPMTTGAAQHPPTGTTTAPAPPGPAHHTEGENRHAPPRRRPAHPGRPPPSAKHPPRRAGVGDHRAGPVGGGRHRHRRDRRARRDQLRHHRSREDHLRPPP